MIKKMIPQTIWKVIIFITSVGANYGCNIVINELEYKKDMFLQMMDDGIKLVYFDLKIPPVNDTQSFSLTYEKNDTYKNGLLRWIWSKEDVGFLLTYPDDFPALTFNWLDGTFTKHLDLELSFPSFNCNFSYANYSYNLNLLLYKNFFENQSDWMMCHRMFENQEWKYLTNIILSYWIGYDFECFNSDCEYDYPKCTQIISKSTINYVIIAFLCVIGLYYPLLLLFLPKRIDTKEIQERIDYYQELDCPHSFSRLFLYLSKRYKKHNNAAISIYECLNKLGRLCRFRGYEQQNNADNQDTCLPEFRLFSFILILLYLFQAIQMYLVRHYIGDYFEFKATYGEIGDISFFGLVISDCILYMFLPILPVLHFSFSLAKNVHAFLEKDNTYFIPFFSSNRTSFFRYIKIGNKTVSDKEKNYHGYTAFAHKFLKRIEIVFSINFYLSLLYPIKVHCTGKLYIRMFKKLIICIAVIFLGTLNIVLCLFPLFYFSFSLLLKKQPLYIFLSIYVDIFGIIFFCVTVASALSFLLRLIVFNIFVVVPIYDVSFKVWAIAIATIYYLFLFYQAFVEVYKVLLAKTFDISEQDGIRKKTILVETFGLIVDHICPLRNQILLLAVKILLFVVFLYALIDVTIVRAFGTDAFFEEHLPLIVGVLIPAAALKIYGKDHEQFTLEQCNEIKGILVNAMKNVKEEDNTVEELIGFDCKLWDIWRRYDYKERAGILCSCLCTLPVFIVSFICAVFTLILPCFCHTCNPSCKCMLTKDDIEYSNDIESITEQNDEKIPLILPHSIN